MPHTVVPAWYFRTGYIKTMASMIVKEMKHFSPNEMNVGLHVLFSAHGVPESYIAAGDPYQRQIAECVRLISKEVCHQLSDDDDNVSFGLPKDLAGDVMLAVGATDSASTTFAANRPKPVQFHLSFQSRVGPVKWLQ